MYFRNVDDVVFSQWPWRDGVMALANVRERRAAASSYNKLPTYSPGGATLFDFVVVHNGSKLRTRDVSDDDMWGTAIGWWPAMQRTI